MRTSRYLLIAMIAWGAVAAYAAVRFGFWRPAGTSPATARAPLTPRVGLVVLDGLRHDRFLALMPRLRARAHREGTICAVTTPPLTITVGGIYTLATGDEPSLSFVVNNFRAEALAVDSILGSVRRAGKRSAVVGERVWEDLFGAQIHIRETARDHGPFQSAGDGHGTFAALLARGDCALCVLHDVAVDKAGHRYGLLGAGYARVLDDLDVRLDRLIAGTEGVTWLITSDHGAVDSGNHGGPEPAARSSFVAAWGPAIARGGCAETLAQNDLAPTVAALLGVAIPWHSRGRLAPFVAWPDPATHAETEREVGAQQLAFASALTPAAPASVDEARAVLSSTSLEPPYGTLALAVLPLVFVAMMLLRRLRPWTVPAVATCVVLVAGRLVFSNVVFHRTGYGVAALIFFGVTAAVAMAAVAPRAGVAWGALAALFVVAEPHWIQFVAPLLLALVAYDRLVRGGESTSRAVVWSLAALGAGAACVGAGWTGDLSAVATAVPSPILLAAGAGATAAAAPLLLARRGAPVRLSAAAVYLLVAGPPGVVRLAALALVATVAVAALFKGRARAPRAVLLILLATYASASTPLRWTFTLGFVVFFVVAAEQSADEPDAGLPAWLRAAAILSVGYLALAIEGNRLRMSDVDVLAGFYDGAIPFVVPVQVALTMVLYAVPVAAAALLWLLRAPDPSRVWRALETVPALILARVAVHALAVAGGFATSERSTMDSLYLLAWASMLWLVVLPLARRSASSPRATAVTVAAGATRTHDPGGGSPWPCTSTRSTPP